MELRDLLVRTHAGLLPAAVTTLCSSLLAPPLLFSSLAATNRLRLKFSFALWGIQMPRSLVDGMGCHVCRWSLRQRQHCAGAACAQSLDAGRFVADELGALHLLHPLAADVRPEYEVVCESRVASPAAWNTSYCLQFNRSFSSLTNASCLQYTSTYTYSNFHANFKAYEYE